MAASPETLSAAAPLGWLLGVSPARVLLLMAVVTRTSGMMVSAPIISAANVPANFRALVAAGISLLWWFVLPEGSGALFQVAGAGPEAGSTLRLDWVYLALVLVQEFVIGLIIGYTCNVFFQAISAGASLLSVQMGMQLSNQMDPLNQTEQTGSLSPLYLFLSLTWFLSLNLHHWLFLALDKTLNQIPVAGDLWFTHAQGMQQLLWHLLGLISKLLMFGLLAATPVMALIFIIELGLGFVAKMQPRLNLFMLATPIKILAGLSAMMVSLPTIIWLLERDVRHELPRALMFMMTPLTTGR